jgi:hypothetical protein
VLFALVYPLLRRLFHLFAGSSSDPTSDIEVVVPSPPVVHRNPLGPEALGEQASSSPSRWGVHGRDQQRTPLSSVVVVPFDAADAPR